MTPVQEQAKQTIATYLEKQGDMLLSDPVWLEEKQEWQALVDYKGCLVRMGFTFKVTGEL